MTHTISRCPHCGWQERNLETDICPLCGEKGVQTTAVRPCREWEIPKWENMWRTAQENIVLAPYEKLVERRKYGDLCGNCGHIIQASENQTECPMCGHVYEVEKAIYQIYSPEERETRMNLSKDELIAQLEDIARHKVVAPHHIHINAMCYSVSPRKIITASCDHCQREVQIVNWDDRLGSIESIVDDIRGLGYQAAVMRLCRSCIEKQAIDPLWESTDEIYYLFAFRVDESSDFTYTVTGNVLYYRILSAFLRNETTFVAENDDVIHLREQISVVEAMAGLHSRERKMGGDPDCSDVSSGKKSDVGIWHVSPEEEIRRVMADMANQNKHLGELGLRQPQTFFDRFFGRFK